MDSEDTYAEVAALYDAMLPENPERAAFFDNLFRQHTVQRVLDCACTGDLTHPLLLTEDDAVCRDSWKRIYALGTRMVYPAHGNAPYARHDV